MNIWRRWIRSTDPAAGPSVRLMTRHGCCLCDEAMHVLEAHGLAVTEVDIDRDPELRDRYTDCVPVVIIDGKERFRGRVDPVLLRRLLEGRRRNPADADMTDVGMTDADTTDDASGPTTGAVS